MFVELLIIDPIRLSTTTFCEIAGYWLGYWWVIKTFLTFIYINSLKLTSVSHQQFDMSMQESM